MSTEIKLNEDEQAYLLTEEALSLGPMGKPQRGATKIETPKYTFEDAQGNRAKFESKEVPRIGARIKRAGKTWRRVYDPEDPSTSHLRLALFEDKDGEQVVLYLEPYQVPEFGETIVHNRKRLTRIFGTPDPTLWSVRGKKTVEFVSHSLTRFHPDAPRVDKQGKPVFHSRKEIDEFCSKTQDRKGGGFMYDG
jgi:hypothetical protein